MFRRPLALSSIDPGRFMLKSLCLAALLLTSPLARTEPALTAVEMKWISAGMPVVRHARGQRLPIDIVVQPDDEPDASPIAMGIKDGRCKLVLSLRGNPAASTLFASVPAGAFEAAVEAVFAHEIGHCWRYVQGAWNALPAGFVDIDEATADDRNELQREMRERRREEGYADLVGLAWTQRAHPAQYAVIRAWLERFRGDEVAGQHHDTGAWLRLAREPSAFRAKGPLFLEAEGLWERGLLARP